MTETKMELILELIECQSILQNEYDLNIHKELDLDFLEAISRIHSLLRIVREYPELPKKERANALKILYSYQQEKDGGRVEKLYPHAKPWNELAKKYLPENSVNTISDLVERFQSELMV